MLLPGPAPNLGSAAAAGRRLRIGARGGRLSCGKGDGPGELTISHARSGD
jgi:hypothetical protein